MKFIIIVFTISILHGYCDAQLELKKCNIYDSECQKLFFEDLGMRYAETGVPSIGIPPLDPFHLENVTVPFMDLLTLKLVSGDCLDIKTCTVFKFETDMVNFHKTAEIICDRIVIQGTYEISTNPFIASILGNAHGSGNGSIVLEDWHFKIDYPFEFVKHDDGEIYLQMNLDEAEWESKVLKNVTITADNIMVDDQDVTNAALDHVNTHWKIIFDIFGKSFHEISVRSYLETQKTFFDSVAIFRFLSNDPKQLFLLTNQQCSN